jgi:hypothetical protein
MIFHTAIMDGALVVCVTLSMRGNGSGGRGQLLLGLISSSIGQTVFVHSHVDKGAVMYCSMEIE